MSAGIFCTDIIKPKSKLSLLSGLILITLFFNRFHPKKGREANKTESVTGCGRIRKRNLY